MGIYGVHSLSGQLAGKALGMMLFGVVGGWRIDMDVVT